MKLSTLAAAAKGSGFALPWAFDAFAGLFDLASKRFGRIACDWRTSGTYHAAEEPTRQRYQESTFGPRTVADHTLSNLLELARFDVPHCQVGFLKSLEQTIFDAAGDYFPTGSEFRGLPYQADAELSACRWYLRVVPLECADPVRLDESWIGIAAPNWLEALPGLPLPGISDIIGLWYPAHKECALSGVVVPGGFSLRLFFYTPATAIYTWTVAGRLRGVVQPAGAGGMASNLERSQW